MHSLEPTRWQSILDTQHGVVTVRQILSNGFTPSMLRSAIASGAWVRIFRGVVAVTNGPLDRAMQLEAALLYAGPVVMLSHHTAAEEWGILRPTPGPIHVTVPYRCSAVSQLPVRQSRSGRQVPELVHVHPGVTVHRSRAFAWIGVQFDPPRTSKVDTVLDLAVSEPSARTAMNTLVSAMSGGAVPVGAVRKQVELRRPQRYRKAILDTLALLSDGVQSVLEYRYAVDVEQAHHLPQGRRQAPHHVDGRVLFEDVDYSPCGVPLIVRLDGQAFHSARQRRFRDRRRDNAAELSGRPRLSYGWDDVALDPCAVYREIRDVLVREGWEDRSQKCEACG